MDGVLFQCPTCGIEFGVCRSCWKGQHYCSPLCSKLGRLHKHRITQNKYSKTLGGRQSHRKRQCLYRRQKDSETDQTTKRLKDPLKQTEPIIFGRCINCERRLEKMFKPLIGERPFSFRRISAYG